MATDTAVKVALDLLLLPTRVRAARHEPLPPGVESLLRIVSGDEAFIVEVAQDTGRAPDTLRQAAAFYIEQVLLHPEADFYRNLGASPGSSLPDLRHRMAMLMGWLHPDKGVNSDRQALARRVLDAWQTLSNETCRAAYDTTLNAMQTSRDLHQNSPHPAFPRERYALPPSARRRRFIEGLKVFMFGERPPFA